MQAQQEAAPVTPTQQATIARVSGVSLGVGGTSVGYRAQDGTVCPILPQSTATRDSGASAADDPSAPTSTLVPTTSFQLPSTTTPLPAAASTSAPRLTPTPDPSSQVAGIRPPSTGDGGLVSGKDLLSFVSAFVVIASGLGLVTSPGRRS
jgi:hypothetical protein